ncbi:hypothetical protein [Dictyobacter kobayashii]|uniref:Uncharacterized protein n=1 Tax=Dictyobacter kobayashii TaxID=2014872 RepID=A0A402AUE7_9CHLR|nr:hypothetical protein [Dictyobacter kobayashii]GCE22742.1 hypothetical protein KDK_65420 [Dictyobacter kobayashii]
MQALPSTGITIKQYGKFHIRELRTPPEQQPLGMLQISLEQATTPEQDATDELFIGYIPAQNSDLPFVQQRIRFWVLEQQSQLNQVEQWMSDTFDAETLEKMQELNNILEDRYRKVLQALQEIDHSHQG